MNYAKIRQLRESLALTQGEAATRAGFDLKAELARQTWYLIESGRRSNMTVGTLEKVAAVLGVTACDLLTPPPEKPSKPSKTGLPKMP